MCFGTKLFMYTNLNPSTNGVWNTHIIETHTLMYSTCWMHWKMLWIKCQLNAKIQDSALLLGHHSYSKLCHVSLDFHFTCFLNEPEIMDLIVNMHTCMYPSCSRPTWRARCEPTHNSPIVSLTTLSRAMQTFREHEAIWCFVNNWLSEVAEIRSTRTRTCTGPHFLAVMLSVVTVLWNYLDSDVIHYSPCLSNLPERRLLTRSKLCHVA